MNRVLVIAPGWLEDVVMSNRLYKYLHAVHNNISIYVLSLPGFIPLLHRMPEVSQIITMLIGHEELRLIERYKLAKKKYNQLIVLPNSFKSAIIRFFIGAKVRTGYVGEMCIGLLNNIRYTKKDSSYVRNLVSLVYPKTSNSNHNIILPSLKVDINNRVNLIKKLKFTTNKLIALCTGANFGPSKRWPV